MERFVVVDLETTGHASHKDDKIIEIGIAVIENLKIVETYSTFVNPKRSIPPFIQSLTGIEHKDVEGAPCFNEVATEVRELFKASYFVAHNVDFDFNFLNNELLGANFEKLTSPVIDTVELARILLPRAPSYKLSEVAEYINIKHDQPHRALADAIVTAELFIFLMEKLVQLPKETINHLIRLEPLLQSDLKDLLHNALNKNQSDYDGIVVHQGLAFKRIEQIQSSVPVIDQSFETFVTELYKSDGLLERKYPSYSKRPGQTQISETIHQAFQLHKHALIEAGTGIGKTLAYLIPALYQAVQKNTRVVISTHTKQLQNQIVESELPSLIHALGLKLDVAVLKGRANYLSLENFTYELRNLGNDNYDVALAKSILAVWITETSTGDFDEIHLPSGAHHFRLRINADDTMPKEGRSNWNLSHSYHERAKQSADSAHLIVVNHALLCIDIKNKTSLIPSYDYLIVDEGHHLIRVATEQLSREVNYSSVQNLLNRIQSETERETFKRIIQQTDSLHRWMDDYSNLKYELDEFFQMIHRSTFKQSNNDLLNDHGRKVEYVPSESENDQFWMNLKEIGHRVVIYMKETISGLNRMKHIDFIQEKHEFVNKLSLFIQQLTYLYDVFVDLFMNQQRSKQVCWIEVGAKGHKNSIYLCVSPKNTKELFQHRIFDEKASTIVLGSTLTVNDSFHYLKSELGIVDQVIEEKIQSPFNYAERAKLFIPSDFPEVQVDDNEEYVLALSEAILSLAETIDGRILVLFTSFEMLRQTYMYLKELLEEKRYMLFAQSITAGSRDRLKKNFESFDNSILLGTNSFWEGIDFSGNSPKAVVIGRLPFESPLDPLNQIKEIELQKEEKNPFQDYTLPKAILRFKQGFGRLIRHESDKGILFICDDRIMTKGYGVDFLKSIPQIQLKYDSTKNLMQSIKNWF